jgi:light-regulated signal transduction histidine kinase (bacteriophytochrome)
MTVEELQQQLARTEAGVRELQQELADTNRGVAALVLEVGRRLEERDAALRSAAAALEGSNAKLTSTETAVRMLQEELSETSRGMLALNLELEQRVDSRTAELRQLNLELEGRVQERTIQLRQANDNLQNFAHSAAHDLRSPLRAIANFSAMVLEDHGAQLGADGQSLLQRVTQAASQMRQLLDDLLEYSKLSQAELRLEAVRLHEAVREALGLVEADIRARKALITVPDSLPEIIGHPPTVALLISNYISNALKFIPPGVQPQVRIWAEPRPPALVIRLWVEDNGIGIEPQGIGRLFGVFQRLHSKTEYPGTGLGLAIVRKGAERMGGAVGVESTPGQGSRFWLELPQASPAAAEGAS